MLTSSRLDKMNNKICILCKFSNFKIISSQVRDTKNHKVIKCLKCGHVQLYPIPTVKEDKEFYDKEMQDVGINYSFKLAEVRRLSSTDVDRRAALIQKLIPKNKKILEVGSGDGFFLEKMQKEGYDMTGVEVSKQRRIKSRRVTDVKVLNVNLMGNVSDIGSFDGIVLFQVLEHILDPINFLKNISKLLKPRGKLIVEVPNFNDFQIEINDAYRNWCFQRAHINYFIPNILKKVFVNAGLKVKVTGVQRYSIENMFSWKLTNKPQINNPTFNLRKEYEWVEKYYKTKLEKKLISDTIIAIGQK
jgi:2-polyprenyl-3-methyl-5-hydroxy-6-metoxy-1,4-benzoquinol methylase